VAVTLMMTVVRKGTQRVTKKERQKFISLSSFLSLFGFFGVPFGAVQKTMVIFNQAKKWRDCDGGSGGGIILPHRRNDGVVNGASSIVDVIVIDIDLRCRETCQYIA